MAIESVISSKHRAGPNLATVMLSDVGQNTTTARTRSIFVQLFREAWAIVAAYPLAVLGAALIGFGGAAIIGNLVYSALIIDVYRRTGSYFSSTANIFYAQLQLQAFLGTLSFSIGRGALAWIGLRAGHENITLRNALRAATRNWLSLFISAMLYGLLMSAAVAGLTLVLREVRLEQSNFRWLRSEPGALSHATIVRAISLSVPDPGSPFTEAYSYMRYSLARTSNTVYYGWTGYTNAINRLPLQLLVLGLASLVLVGLTESFLCLRHAAIMSLNTRHVLSWLREVIPLTRAHFWQIIGPRILLRLLIFLLTVLFYTVPITLQQGLIVPMLVRGVSNYLPFALTQSFSSIFFALINMMFIAFVLLFDSRLYLMLKRQDK